MRLKLDELQKLVKRTLDEGKAADAFKAEIGRVLGPVVVIEGKLSEVAASANDRLDVLEHTGRTGTVTFESSVATGYLDHTDPEVRKLAARVVPEKYLGRVARDRNPEVRAAVAARLQLPQVREMMKLFPHDDQLRVIFKRKKALVEAGLPKPETKPLGIDPVAGKERMGDVARTQPGPELGKNWYHEHAMRFMRDYGQNIEYAWEELAVHRFCASTKATSGVEIDESTLLKAVKDIIKEKEDRAMKHDALKETLSWLQGQDDQETLAEGIIPDMQEPEDAVTSLVQGRLTGEQYLEAASRLFKVQEGMLPLGIRKYRLGEGNARQTMIPVIAMLPHRHGFRAIDERALDTFCEHWTKRQALQGEPLRLEWTNHPSDMNKVGFTVVLK